MTGAELQWKQDQILLRYRQLVDKKWVDGLSPQEEIELEELSHQVDKILDSLRRI